VSVYAWGGISARGRHLQRADTTRGKVRRARGEKKPLGMLPFLENPRAGPTNSYAKPYIPPYSNHFHTCNTYAKRKSLRSAESPCATVIDIDTLCREDANCVVRRHLVSTAY
jgi:hypothetical protein